MENSQNKKSIVLCMLITGFLIFTFSLNIAAQDSAKTRSKKGVVVLKIKKDDNGKTTVIDTTFTLTDASGRQELEEFLKQHEKELKNLSEDLGNIEVMVDIPDVPDSMATDSLIKQMKIITKDIRCPHFKWYNNPEGFDYEFEVPCHHDFPSPPCHGFEGVEDEYFLGDDWRGFKYKNKRQTLSYILGDIPMDRVKKYSIKDKKNGKKIIIEVENAPLNERQDRIIVIREPGKQSHIKGRSDRQMKVIIQSDDDKQIEEPAVPPKGKQNKPDESSARKPRIFPYIM
jgi:hypothetical protein